jgi:hypothetical protein
LAAALEERREYVEKATAGCISKGLGLASASKIEQGVTDFFMRPNLRHYKVSYAFGQIFTAISKLGDYHRFLDGFGMGP